MLKFSQLHCVVINSRLVDKIYDSNEFWTGWPLNIEWQTFNN